MATGPVVRDTLRMAPIDAARADPELVSRVPYLPGLDGLRALAVVAVMIYHANPSWLPGGFLGVEVFFVISGYLITLLLIAERERTGRVALGQFWMRRARRLLPALFVTLFIVVSYTALFRTEALGQIRGDVVASLFYVTNWYQVWVGQGYTASGDFAPLRHLWSLAVEEQFYLVWPLVMAVLLRVGPRRVTASARWLMLAAIALTAVIAIAYHPGRIADCDITPGAFFDVGQRCISKADTLYLSTVTRAGGLLLGAALAMVWRPGAIMRSPMRSKGAQLDVLAVLGLAGLGAMTWWVHFMTPDGADPLLFRGGFFVTSLLTLLVIAAVTHQRARAGAVLGNPLFLWVGTRSYGLYLYHWPIYQVIREVAGNRLTLTQFARRDDGHRRRHRTVVPMHRNADPPRAGRSVVEQCASIDRQTAAADRDGRCVGLHRAGAVQHGQPDHCDPAAERARAESARRRDGNDRPRGPPRRIGRHRGRRCVRLVDRNGATGFCGDDTSHGCQHLTAARADRIPGDR